MPLDRDILRVEQILVGLEKITRWLAHVPSKTFTIHRLNQKLQSF